MSAKRSIGLLCAAFVLAGAGGSPCSQKPEPHKWTLEEVQESAVLVRPVELKADRRFSLRAVLEQILRTSGASKHDAPAQDALLQTLLASLAASEFTNPDSKLRMRVDRRAQESTLPATALANELVPIGLFNRLDGMSVDASDCGEYRIAFASPNRSFLLIFEARMPNTGGVAACGKIARFWQKLEAMPVAARLNALADFYFKGVEGFPAAINSAHFGPQLGQVRSNTFVDSPWMLREWKVAPRPGAPIFEPHPLGSPTPLTEFYGDGDPGSLDPQKQAAERQAFQDALVGTHAAELVHINAKDTNLPGVTLNQVIVATMGTRIPRRFQEFQSDAMGSDIPRAGSALNARLPNSSGAAPQVIDKDQLMNRAGVITCGGCHNFSGGAIIGKVNGTELRWPAATGFRHIGPEADSTPGQNMISPAVRDFFIPYRRANMVRFLNETEGMAPRAGAASQDEATELFRAIVSGQKLAPADLEQYNRLVADRTNLDIAKEGYFVRSRRSH